MKEQMLKIQATLRRWWWAIGGWVIAVLVGGCCPAPVVMYGPPPAPEYGIPPITMTPVVLYGPPVPEYGPPPVTPETLLPFIDQNGELLSVLAMAAFAVVGIVWVGQHRKK